MCNNTTAKGERTLITKKSTKVLYYVISALFLSLVLTLVMGIGETSTQAIFYNLILVLPVFGLLLMITRSFNLASIVTALLAFAVDYIDQCVYSIRLAHIRLSDIRLIPEAMRVVRRYHPIWNGDLAYRLVLVIALAALLCFVYRKAGLNSSKKHVFLAGLGALIISLGIIVSGIIPSGSKEDFYFVSETENRGLFYSWYCQVQESRVEPPEGYSDEAAQAILGRYKETDGVNDVRIIVIMNEALADYSLLGETDFEDPLPFIHSLHENFYEGKMAVSVFGGGTANTEFEFLTGNALAFLPEGSTPYLQFVNHEMESLVSSFEGREKLAVHPYYAREYGRAQVYQFFGFDKFISGEDFGITEANDESVTYVRRLVSDQSCFEKIQSENADFTFSVTIQNHGYYNYSGSDFHNIEYVPDAPEISQYLTVSNLSDQAFAWLIRDLEKSDQKTIVLMFGDHQPGVVIAEDYVECDVAADTNYIVPYILWANYDIEFEAPAYVSPNYLSAVLKLNAGLPLNAWDQFRLDTMSEYPVITSNYIIDKDGNFVSDAKLNEYKIVQYWRLFQDK